MRRPSIHSLREARARFARLLGESRVPEAEWQRLFRDNPFVLSSALPLRLAPDDIKPLGRPGKSEPDLIFYPKARNAQQHYAYGVIELKTSHAAILSTPRTNLITLSREASTAIEQARSYLRDFERTLKLDPTSEALFVGSAKYAFVIMGLREELARKIVNGLLQDQLKELIPPGFQILPYDLVFELFERSALPRLVGLFPTVSAADSGAILTHLSESDEEALFLLKRYGHLVEGSVYFYWVSGSDAEGIKTSLGFMDLLGALRRLEVRVPPLVGTVQITAPLPDHGPWSPEDTVKARCLTSYGEVIVDQLLQP